MMVQEIHQTFTVGIEADAVELDLVVAHTHQVVHVDDDQADVQEDDRPCAADDGVDHADEGANGTPGTQLDDRGHHHGHQGQDSTNVTQGFQQDGSNRRHDFRIPFSICNCSADVCVYARMGFRAAARVSF